MKHICVSVSCKGLENRLYRLMLVGKAYIYVLLCVDTAIDRNCHASEQQVNPSGRVSHSSVSCMGILKEVTG